MTSAPWPIELEQEKGEGRRHGVEMMMMMMSNMKQVSLLGTFSLLQNRIM